MWVVVQVLALLCDKFNVIPIGLYLFEKQLVLVPMLVCFINFKVLINIITHLIFFVLFIVLLLLFFSLDLSIWLLFVLTLFAENKHILLLLIVFGHIWRSYLAILLYVLVLQFFFLWVIFVNRFFNHFFFLLFLQNFLVGSLTFVLVFILVAPFLVLVLLDASSIVDWATLIFLWLVIIHLFWGREHLLLEATADGLEIWSR